MDALDALDEIAQDLLTVEHALRSEHGLESGELASIACVLYRARVRLVRTTGELQLSGRGGVDQAAE